MTLLIDVLLFRAYSPPSPSLSGIYPTFFPPISRTLDRYSRRCTKSLASWPVGEKNSCYGSHLVASYPGDRQANPCVRHLTLFHAYSVRLRGLALDQVPHVGDDRVLAEEKCPLDEKGRLIVQEVLPPSPREEFRQNDREDRKSTRLNSSHVRISYAVFCLKKKKKNTQNHTHAHTDEKVET